VLLPGLVVVSLLSGVVVCLVGGGFRGFNGLRSLYEYDDGFWYEYGVDLFFPIPVPDFLVKIYVTESPPLGAAGGGSCSGLGGVVI
jgi:hypothetical protein